MTKNEILNLVKKVENLKKSKDNALPGNSFFLDKDEILCYPNEIGDSRYPYYRDGLALFAHSDGYIDCVEGELNVFKTAHFNEDTVIAFFGGEKYKDGFMPISITGAARQLYEDDVTRYTVFTPVCAYYITQTSKAIFAARTYVDKQKNIRFSVGVVNLAEQREIYLSAFFESCMRNDPYESFWVRMAKYGQITDNGGYVLRSVNNYLAIRCESIGNITEKYQTTAKNDFVGNKGGNLTNALALKKGKLDITHNKVNTTEIPAACDLIRFNLEKDGFAQMNYQMQIVHDEDSAIAFASSKPDFSTEEQTLSDMRTADKQIYSKTNIHFDDWHNDKINPNVLNNFLDCVRRQVSLCALGKNYAGPMLGIRDVFQQLELSLIWQKEQSRDQIVKVMNYILEDGRPPRQITLTIDQNKIPPMDLRPFIDQGLWIFSTIHTYLSYTDDYSILDEICGYYKTEKTYGPLSLSPERDSILSHLLRIMNFLISNIDANTGCLRALYGDWNDALDGLGRTKDKDKEFGNGVSVMATLQLYLALGQMSEILEKVGGHQDTVEYYKTIKISIANGVKTYALAIDENGFAKMVHGWGDNREYFVGSFNDHDGVSRISLTANAFCAISGIMENFPEYKNDIVKNITDLDSRFGLLTFDKPFLKFTDDIGRLSSITPGTYENACTYVHAGMFGASALFLLGASKQAWDAVEKGMVISHDKVTMSTFVMPNSYCIDGEYNFDGESMGDWYTGSGAVLIKNFIKYGFGIEPDMNNLKIIPTAYFPAKSAQITLPICDKTITVKYENRKLGSRKIYLDGKELALEFDAFREVKYAIIPKELLSQNSIILITD